MHQSNERYQRFLHGRRFALLDNNTCVWFLDLQVLEIRFVLS